MQDGWIIFGAQFILLMRIRGLLDDITYFVSCSFSVYIYLYACTSRVHRKRVAIAIFLFVAGTVSVRFVAFLSVFDRFSLVVRN